MEKHYGFIYLTIDLKNGKGYIGQHKIHNQKTLDPDYIGSGVIIGDIKKKYGLKRFNRQILCYCENQEELNEKEIEYIAYFNAVESENFYNIAEGGYKNPLAGKTIEEMKEYSNMLSRAQKERWANTTDERKKELSKKYSEAVKKYHKNKTEEQRQKTNKKISESKKGKKAKLEVRLKMSEDRKGSGNGMYGKHQKEESKIKNRRSRKCYCKELDMYFPYMEAAARYCTDDLKIAGAAGIKHVCRGVRKFAGTLPNGIKLTWRYVDENDIEDIKKYNEYMLSQNVNDCNKKERT